MKTIQNKIINRISESRYSLLPAPNQRTMSQRAYTRIVIDATKKVIKGMYADNVDIYDMQSATREAGGNYDKAFIELYGNELKF